VTTMSSLTRAVGLLERAVGYGLESVESVRPGSLGRPTPCAGWDLGTLLCHVNESLAALGQGACGGRIDLVGSAAPDGRPAVEELAAGFRDGTRRLLDGWRQLGSVPAPDGPTMEVGGAPIAPAAVALIGAVEVAVHGWDIAEACGQQCPVPVRLALDLLHWTPLLVDGASADGAVLGGGARHPLFAAPVPVSPLASPSDRLVGCLGRSPRGWARGN
jgi:uncharacterized protein (TIGR03086 family)